MEPHSKIYVAGHQGLVGSAVLRHLLAKGFYNLVYRTHTQLDLTDDTQVKAFFAAEQPEYVILAAARVGGIQDNNTHPVDFITTNLRIQTHVIESAWQHRCRKFLFFGSSCIYPLAAPQPVPEAALMTGPLEPTNEAYAIAKIAGIKMLEAYHAQYGMDYVVLMPNNLYGPGDHFDPVRGHVIPALMAKFKHAIDQQWPEIEIWGSGSPLREFLHVDDLADATYFVLQQNATPRLINIGSDQEISIRELAENLKTISGYTGTLTFNPQYPDGSPRKWLDCTLLHALGWHAHIPLQEGLASTWQWLQAHGSPN